MNPSNPFYRAGSMPYAGLASVNGRLPYYPTPYAQAFSPVLAQAGLSYFEDGSDKDTEYMKQLYPKAARQIQKEIDEQCDKLEYEGSFMFDDYPDPIRLQVLVDSIYQSLENKEPPNAALSEMAVVKEQPAFRPPCAPGRFCPPPRPAYRPDGSPDWLRDLIEIMLYQEMLHRRKRYRNRRRWY